MFNVGDFVRLKRCHPCEGRVAGVDGNGAWVTLVLDAASTTTNFLVRDIELIPGPMPQITVNRVVEMNNPKTRYLVSREGEFDDVLHSIDVVYDLTKIWERP